jgi:Na+/phosphate symporter
MFYLGIGEHAHLHWTDTSRYVFFIVYISLPETSVIAVATPPLTKKVAFWHCFYNFFPYLFFLYLILPFVQTILFLKM